MLVCAAQCEVPEGGLVPKSMYRTAEELDNEGVRLWTETIYQSASVFKGAPHEVRLDVDRRSCKPRSALDGPPSSGCCGEVCVGRASKRNLSAVECG